MLHHNIFQSVICGAILCNYNRCLCTIYVLLSMAYLLCHFFYNLINRVLFGRNAFHMKYVLSSIHLLPETSIIQEFTPC